MVKDMFYDLGDIYLRGLSEKDLLGSWYKWFNDPEVTEFEDKKIFANTYEKQKDYFEYLRKSQTDVVLAIARKDNDQHIGNIGLHKIDYIHRRAEVGIVIGEKDCWGKGYASRSVECIRDYAFNVLNLHRLTALIMKGNESSYKVFTKYGFKEEGVLRNYFYKNGKYLDAHIVGCVRDD
jgi:RimJ/RimL family protein N-acetyltransferase